jgi:hypothetical protein
MKAKEQNSKLTQVIRKNYRKANFEIVGHLLENLKDVEIPVEAKEKGMLAEQPCRLERVPNTHVAQVIDGNSSPLEERKA